MSKFLLAVLLAVSFGVQAADEAGFVTINPEYENVHGTGNDNQILNIITGVKLENSVTVDLKTAVSNTDNTKAVSAVVETRARYDYSLDQYGLKNFTVWGRLGLGEKLTSSGDFGYYTVEPGVSYSINPKLNVTVSDRFRDSFENNKGYETNTVYLATSYHVSTKDTVGGDMYRKYGDVESTGIELAYTRWF